VGGKRRGDVVADVWRWTCRDNLKVDQEQAAASRLKAKPLIATKGCRCVILGERETVAEVRRLMGVMGAKTRWQVKGKELARRLR